MYVSMCICFPCTVWAAETVYSMLLGGMANICSLRCSLDALYAFLHTSQANGFYVGALASCLQCQYGLARSG